MYKITLVQSTYADHCHGISYGISYHPLPDGTWERRYWAGGTEQHRCTACGRYGYCPPADHPPCTPLALEHVLEEIHDAVRQQHGHHS